MKLHAIVASACLGACAGTPDPFSSRDPSLQGPSGGVRPPTWTEGPVRRVARADAVPSPDAAADAWTWDLGGHLGVQAVVHGERSRKSDGLETDIASVQLCGASPGGTEVLVDADLDGEDTRHNLSEAWIAGDTGAFGRIRAGLLRAALGSEFATRGEDLPFVGRAFPSSLLGRTDLGVAVDGRPVPNLFASLTATAGEGFGSEGERRSGQQIGVRVMATPEPDADGAFDGPFAGVAFAYVSDYDEPIHLATPVEQTVFTTPRLAARRARFAVLELGARMGSFRGGIEHVFGEGLQSAGTGVFGAPTPGGDVVDFEQLGAWSLFVAWTFGGVAPHWERGGWAPRDTPPGDMPMELALRYSNADIDRALFDEGITTYDPSSQEVRTFDAAFGVQVRPATRLLLSWVRVLADDDLTTLGGTNRATSWVLRWDERF